MADYWKSQPRKFCQYCKCWIADNKPSIDFHERGKNHKENVAAKISEIKKKCVEKAKQEERMSKQFAAMEEAAMKAYEEDLKRMDLESKGLPYVAPAAPPPKPQSKPQPKKSKKKQEKGRGRPRYQAQTQVWVEGVSEEGHTYYYNTITGESRWQKPEQQHGESSASAQYKQTESSSGCAWMEAVSPDGHTYYYNSNTGESSWEKPADFPPNEASQPTAEEDSEQDEPGGEESCGEATPSPEADVSEETSASGDGESSQQPNVPKISFRKRKAEAEPLEKEEAEIVSDDKSSADATNEDEEAKKEEEVRSTPAEPEEKKQTTEGTIKGKRPRTNPYGAWEKIKEEVDPYAKVDLQLPQVEESATAASADVPPEPKHKFKERIITSLGDEGGGPASFRKNKAHNGKSRSLRQRDNDD